MHEFDLLRGIEENKVGISEGDEKSLVLIRELVSTTDTHALLQS